MDKPNRVPEIKAALTDVQRVLESLGLLGEARHRQKQSAGFIVRCPVHEDRTPSCSVQLRHGVILWRCHGCQATGDVLTLVAAARGLSVQRDFRAVLVEAARLGGLWQVVDELEGRGVAPPMPIAAPRLPQDEPERSYPAPGEVETLWRVCGPVAARDEASAYLRGRGIDPDRVDAGDLARALPGRGTLPTWAWCRGGSWRDAGYRIVVPMFDAGGELRSVRGWRVTPGDELPKRIPPTGHKASELVMADTWALAWLRGQREPERIVVTEGEPDFCVWATRMNDPTTATIGVVSGSWSPQLANRFPIGARVDVRTDCDKAGDRYAREIEQSLRRRCFVHWTRRAA